jgi:hypothetical protein
VCTGFSGQVEGRRLGNVAIDRGMLKWILKNRMGQRGMDSCVQGPVADFIKYRESLD